MGSRKSFERQLADAIAIAIDDQHDGHSGIDYDLVAKQVIDAMKIKRLIITDDGIHYHHAYATPLVRQENDDAPPR